MNWCTQTPIARQHLDTTTHDFTHLFAGSATVSTGVAGVDKVLVDILRERKTAFGNNSLRRHLHTWRFINNPEKSSFDKISNCAWTLFQQIQHKSLCFLVNLVNYSLKRVSTIHICVVWEIFQKLSIFLTHNDQFVPPYAQLTDSTDGLLMI